MDPTRTAPARIGALDLGALISHGVEVVPWFSLTGDLPISKEEW